MKHFLLFIAVVAISSCGSKTESAPTSNESQLTTDCDIESKFLTKYKTDDPTILLVFRIVDGQLVALYENNGIEEPVVDIETENCHIISFESGSLPVFEEIDGVNYFSYYMGGASGGGSTFYFPEYTSSKEAYRDDEE